MTVLPCPGATAWPTPSSTDSRTAATATSGVRSCRPTKSVYAEVSRSTPRGSTVAGPGVPATSARHAPPALTPNDASVRASGDDSRSCG